MGRPGKKADRLKDTASLEKAGLAGAVAELQAADDAEARPESVFADHISAEHRQRLGQYFTPPHIARIMCEWVAAIRPGSFLDPAAGPGVFLRAFRDVMGEAGGSCSITAVEVDPIANRFAQQVFRDDESIELIQADFLTWSDQRRFDAIVANPPYLRHHDLAYDFDIHRTIGDRNGVKLSRLTNAYGLFLLEICRRLAIGGRAALIVPGEWLNANFGMPLKEYLLNRGLLELIVYYSHASAVFDDALTTATLLFVEKPAEANAREGVRTVFVSDGFSMDDLRTLLRGGEPEGAKSRPRHLPTALLRRSSKWNSLLENGSGRRIPGFVPLSEMASTCRGIATGANRFLHVSNQTVADERISRRHTVPCIGQARSARGLVFDSSDFAQLDESGRRSRLLCFNVPLSEHDRRYLRRGESLGLPERYLLSKRTPWYAMESREAAPIWAAVFGRKLLRFVWNRAGVLNLTTFHCVYPRFDEPDRIAALVACLNSRVVQDMAKAQQRVYGGGLLKFEPRDLLEIRVPDVRGCSETVVKELADMLARMDRVMRDGDEAKWDELDCLVMRAAEEGASRGNREAVSGKDQ